VHDSILYSDLEKCLSTLGAWSRGRAPGLKPSGRKSSCTSVEVLKPVIGNIIGYAKTNVHQSTYGIVGNARDNYVCAGAGHSNTLQHTLANGTKER
jgi:hypothetical protein